MYELDPSLYTVAWLAPLEIEVQAALHMLDNVHDGQFALGRGDDYVFHAGDICGHNIIVATLPAGQEYGTGSAAALASQVKKFFPNLWFGLLVGVAAGLPNLSTTPPRDIRLGDVLVALPEGNNAGLIAYDLGKETGKDGFQLLRFGHVLATTETVIRSAIGSIKLKAPNDAKIFLPYYETMKEEEHINGTFVDPGQDHDIFYEVDDQGVEKIVERARRPDSKRTRVWYGPIGSGEKLMKNAQKRNELRDKYGVIGLEMEAAGTMNRIPVGVIRGVCDYGDEHKNKDWQPYAAAMAAAYAKAVLHKILPHKVPGTNMSQVEAQTYSPQGAGGPVFNGPITGRNVLAGMSVSGGISNFNFS
ncbi:putative nacht and wd domain protein [Phaeoacremonium minimum UCRPA7]|uniref:Putative nacht and wd domain protein n=1 Tax=Phaeoacremonium minimum (strain UCR-PA7) TaxID=1286976 RepID=R8BFS9_PHAM7|nr:putative nacht and wd domain protein [Phaeoacremonium minimum UCRPA7]EON98166.1 putative nacht and wd domain protein [Phaeoacremonium minimum UCRPA7]